MNRAHPAHELPLSISWIPRRSGVLKRACGWILLINCTVVTLADENLMQARELLTLPQPAPDHRHAYGEEPSQFGELYLPTRKSPGQNFPVVVLVHGGCWQAQWGLDHLRHLADQLRGQGYAAWNLEYRKLGQPGGGWPGSCADIDQGVDALAEISTRFALDLDRVVVVGHSAGGHLALWLACDRANRSVELPAAKVQLRGAIGLAPITDLLGAAAAECCGTAAADFLSVDPSRRAEIDPLASPIHRLPAKVPLRLLHGAEDDVVPLAQSEDFAQRAAESGSDCRFETIAGIGHYEQVAARGPAWEQLLATLKELLPPTTP